MTRSKRLAPLVVSIGLVLALGGVSIAVSASANREARDIHRADRSTLNQTLAGLTNQYLRFAFKEAHDFATSNGWELVPADGTDAASLQAFVERSALFNHAAVLTTLDGQPINAFSRPPGLPEPTDPGYAPLRRDLSAGRPGLSSVMSVGGTPVVSVAVPVVRDGAPRALLLAFFRPDTSPLQVYSEQLDHGPEGLGYVVDSTGTVVVGSRRADVGRKLDASPALDAMRAGRKGFLEFERDGATITAAYAPIGLGGWGDAILQPAEQFFGPINAGGRSVNIAVLVLLAAAATGLAVLNFFRERALRTAYDYKGQLLANTTHELKTPLTAIRGAAITLGTRWRDLPDESVDQLLGMIHRRCDGLSKLVDRILMGARLDAGRELELHPDTVELSGVLRRIATEFADASPRHTFKVVVPDELAASVDPEVLDQVVGMLVENAIKYSPDGGEIRLDALAAGERVLVRVADSGIGMSDEDQRHVFEPYYRANRGDDQAYGGVGLGLAITRHLVHRSGGEIEVRSRLGEGTIFAFSLPRVDDGSEEAGRRRADRVRGWVPVAEAARSAGVHPNTVRAWLRQGRIRSETVERNGRPVCVVAVEDVEAKLKRAEVTR